MAIAKTPKTTVTAAAKPAAVKPVIAAKKPAAAKPATAAKAPEEAIIHSAEVAAESTAQVAESVTVAAKAIPSEIVEAVAEAPAAKATAVVVKQAKAAVNESFSKGVGPLLDFSRESAILLVSTGNELALGFHKLSLSWLDWSAESCDKGVAASQAMLSAKTVEEVMDLSRSLAQDSLQQVLKESSELSALSTKLFEDTLAPLPGRFAATVEKLTSHAA